MFRLPGLPSRYLLALALTVLTIISTAMTTDSGEQEIYEIKNGADHSVVLNSVSAVLASGALFSTSVVLPSIFTILTGEQIFVIRKKKQ